MTSEISLKLAGGYSKSLHCSKPSGCVLIGLAFLVLMKGLLKLEEGI
jgi:hypothetical protein